MNIAIVANTSFNIVNFRLPLMQFLKNKGYNVIAIAPIDDYTNTITEHHFHFIPITKLSRKGTNPFQDVQLLLELKKIYKKNNIDIALQYTIKPNIYGSLAAAFTPTKTISTVTGLGYTFLNNSIASSISKLLYKIAFKFSNIINFQNQDDAKLFIKYKLATQDKTNIINGSGIDTNLFQPNFCDNINKNNKYINFLFIGRLLKDKGIFEFIEAAKKILTHNNNVLFTIVGDLDENNPSGLKKETLDELLNHQNIVYKGFLKDTRTEICKADCIVLPSYREGMPRVLLEAMAMQKPCITTNVAGCRDAVDEHCAIICNVEDANDLTNAIQKFISLDQEVRVNMGKHARIRAETMFSSNIIAQNYLAQILKLFNKH